MIQKACFVLLILSVVSSTCVAQEWARKMFEITNHDFKTVPRGADTKFAFKFKNIYKEDIHISHVRSSCGCTTPTVTKDLVKTYETSEIVAAFNTNSFLGHKSATLTVVIDQPYYAEVQLTVNGYIRSDVVVSPGNIDFGSVDSGTSVKKTVSVQYLGSSDWKVVGVNSENDNLAAEVVTTTQFGQNNYTLNVTLSDKTPVGYLKDSLTLVTNDPQTPHIPVEVQAQVNSEVSVRPQSLFLGIVRDGATVSKQVVVKGKRPFTIVSVDCDDDCFKFGETSQTPKIFHVLPITFLPKEKSGQVSTKIKIHTSLGEEITADFQAYAQISKG